MRSLHQRTPSHPTNSASQCTTTATCPDGTGYEDIYKANCVDCPYQGCKTCDLSVANQECTECLQAGYKAIDFSVSPYLSPRDPNYGEKKCVNTASVEGYYIDGNNFKPCLSHCKTCSDGTTCTECQPPAGSSATYHRITSTSPHRCTTCLNANHEYLTEEATPRCVACPAGHKLMKGGTGPGNCDACDLSNGKFVNGVYCDSCMAGCRECVVNNACTRCLDSGHNVQPGGACAAGCPVNHKPDANGVCQPLNCDVVDCLECSDHDVCSKCRPGVNLQPDLSCQAGCPVNYKPDLDGGCRALVCSISGCLECSDHDVCSKCQPGYLLESNQCSEPAEDKYLQYVLVQQFAADLYSDFTFLMVLEQDAFTATQIEKIRTSLLSLPTSTFTLSLSTQSIQNVSDFEVIQDQNIKILRNSLRDVYFSINLTEPQKTSKTLFQTLRIDHNTINLLKNFEKVNIIISKNSTKYSLEAFRGEQNGILKLSEDLATISKTTSAVNNGMETRTSLAALFLTLLSADSGEVALKFNQFLTLMKTFKYIGAWLGTKLTEFLEIVTGVENGKNEREELKEGPGEAGEGAEGASRRLLLGLEQKRKEKSSKFYRYKLDDYGAQVRYCDMTLVKTVLYVVFWVIKQLAWAIFSGIQVGKNNSNFSLWKVQLLVYARQIHFAVFGATLMELSFLNTRIILHKAENLAGILIKFLAFLSQSLLILDLLDIYLISTGMNYQEFLQGIHIPDLKSRKNSNSKKSKNPKINQICDKNSQKSSSSVQGSGKEKQMYKEVDQSEEKFLNRSLGFKEEAQLDQAEERRANEEKRRNERDKYKRRRFGTHILGQRLHHKRPSG